MLNGTFFPGFWVCFHNYPVILIPGFWVICNLNLKKDSSYSRILEYRSVLGTNNYLWILMHIISSVLIEEPKINIIKRQITG